jgi:hypothetical protein
MRWADLVCPLVGLRLRPSASVAPEIVHAKPCVLELNDRAFPRYRHGTRKHPAYDGHVIWAA